MSQIHPTAVIDPKAELGQEVQIGPYVVIGPDVTLGDRCQVGPHSCLEGPMTVGAGTRIFKHAALGSPPQDLTYTGEPTRLEIGEDCYFGDAANVSRGTVKGGGVTRIGDRTMLMAHTHVGHDCEVGNDVMIVNNVVLAGHCAVADGSYLGGQATLHQFVRVGRLAIVQGCTALNQDCPPFGWAGGNLAQLRGINRVGLKRAGFASETIEAIRQAIKRLFRSGDPLTAALDKLEADGPHGDEVAEIIAFCRDSQRGLVRWGRR